jgi:hypothetical protein
MKVISLLVIAVLLFAGGLYVATSAQPSNADGAAFATLGNVGVLLDQTFSGDAVSAGIPIAFGSYNGMNNFKVEFAPVAGSLSACTVYVDSSLDGRTWTQGGAISGQTCTSEGAAAAGPVAAKFVRLDLTVTGGKVRVRLLGGMSAFYLPLSGGTMSGDINMVGNALRFNNGNAPDLAISRVGSGLGIGTISQLGEVGGGVLTVGNLGVPGVVAIISSSTGGSAFGSLYFGSASTLRISVMASFVSVSGSSTTFGPCIVSYYYDLQITPHQTITLGFVQPDGTLASSTATTSTGPPAVVLTSVPLLLAIAPNGSVNMSCTYPTSGVGTYSATAIVEALN